ncbi:PAZ/Piwi domain protein [Aphelenchoides avenae]|nr:PAZ/Piwi domain protein [Aphelenchus avenae]
MGREAAEADTAGKRVFPPSVIGYSANTNEDPFEFVGDYGFVDIARAQDVDFMKVVVRRCLDLYQQSRGQLPYRVLIYRGDTPEGQYGKVLKYEVPMMYAAIEEMGSQASITLITHSRRQPLRLFKKPIPHGKDDKGPQQNIKPGTVVDTAVVHPTLHQFYLNSHVALQGTAAVPRYDVLHDDNKLSANELETITYWLAFGHQIVFLPTSLPSPVYIGDLYAKRGRDVYNAMKRLGEIEDGADYQELSARVSYYESNLYKLRVNA